MSHVKKKPSKSQFSSTHFELLQAKWGPLGGSDVQSLRTQLISSSIKLSISCSRYAFSIAFPRLDAFSYIDARVCGVFLIDWVLRSIWSPYSSLSLIKCPIFVYIRMNSRCIFSILSSGWWRAPSDRFLFMSFAAESSRSITHSLSVSPPRNRQEVQMRLTSFFFLTFLVYFAVVVQAQSVSSFQSIVLVSIHSIPHFP